LEKDLLPSLLLFSLSLLPLFALFGPRGNQTQPPSKRRERKRERQMGETKERQGREFIFLYNDIILPVIHVLWKTFPGNVCGKN